MLKDEVNCEKLGEYVAGRAIPSGGKNGGDRGTGLETDAGAVVVIMNETARSQVPAYVLKAVRQSLSVETVVLFSSVRRVDAECRIGMEGFSSKHARTYGHLRRILHAVWAQDSGVPVVLVAMNQYMGSFLEDADAEAFDFYAWVDDKVREGFKITPRYINVMDNLHYPRDRCDNKDDGESEDHWSRYVQVSDQYPDLPNIAGQWVVCERDWCDMCRRTI